MDYLHDIAITMTPHLWIVIAAIVIPTIAIRFTKSSPSFDNECEYTKANIKTIKRARKWISLVSFTLILIASLLYGPNTYKNDTVDYQQDRQRDSMMESRMDRDAEQEITLEGVRTSRESNSERAARTKEMLDWESRDEEE